MINVLAVYENGVLRPAEPLELGEGEKVQLAVYPRPDLPSARLPTSDEEAYFRRLKAAKSLTDMYAVMQTAPDRPEDDYDIVKMINESRRLTGFRIPDPEPQEEQLP